MELKNSSGGDLYHLPHGGKPNRGLREEDIMKRKRKEKPVLQVLLIAALALNTTLSFVVLANRNRMAQPTEKKEPVPAPAVITLEGATVEGKTHTAADPCVSAGCRSEVPRGHTRSTGNGEEDCSCKSRESVEGKRRDYLSPLARSLPAHAGYDSRDQKGWRENSYSKRDDWSVWQALPMTIRPWWFPKEETRTV